MKLFLQRWAIHTLAVLVATQVVSGIDYDRDNWVGLLLATLVLGILNAFLRPVLVLLSLPLVLLSLGLFMLVINAFLLYLVGNLFPSFQVDSFFPSAVLGALVISLVSTALNLLTGTGNAKVTIRRGHRRNRRGPPPADDNHGGPFIDV